MNTFFGGVDPDFGSKWPPGSAADDSSRDNVGDAWAFRPVFEVNGHLINFRCMIPLLYTCAAFPWNVNAMTFRVVDIGVGLGLGKITFQWCWFGVLGRMGNWEIDIKHVLGEGIRAETTQVCKLALRE